jgi:hypothetical protein
VHRYLALLIRAKSRVIGTPWTAHCLDLRHRHRLVTFAEHGRVLGGGGLMRKAKIQKLRIDRFAACAAYISASAGMSSYVVRHREQDSRREALQSEVPLGGSVPRAVGTGVASGV